MNFGAMSAIENVTVRDDPIGVNEEATAAREFVAARVESFDCHCGRFYAANELGKNIL
jgi:hypothetical protein